MNEDINTLRRILKQSRTIAVVGLSANWWRPSYFAAKYMQEHGYRVIPVNPQYQEVLGEKCYASLRDVPEKVDIVDCFRRSEDLGSSGCRSACTTTRPPRRLRAPAWKW